MVVENRSEGGFALILVILLLFAIGVAGATSYQIVQSEAAMSLTGVQGSEALSAAHAGLERFQAQLGDNITLPAEVTYSVQGARAVVTPRLVYDGPYPDRTYLIQSVGTFLDPRFPGSPAERTVSQLVVHDRVPTRILGALVSTSTNITISSVHEIDGGDQASSGECDIAQERNVGGVIGGGTINITGGTVAGSPLSAAYPGAAAVMDSLDIDWDMLTDPNVLTVNYQDSWPSRFILALYPNFFPVVRYSASRSVSGCQSGRGVIILEGTLTITSGGGDFCPSQFTWRGLILVENLSVASGVDFAISGAVVEGLDGLGGALTLQNAGDIVYDSCDVLWASESLARITPQAGTWWEVY